MPDGIRSRRSEGLGRVLYYDGDLGLSLLHESCIRKPAPSPTRIRVVSSRPLMPDDIRSRRSEGLGRVLYYDGDLGLSLLHASCIRKPAPPPAPTHAPSPTPPLPADPPSRRRPGLSLLHISAPPPPLSLSASPPSPSL